MTRADAERAKVVEINRLAARAEIAARRQREATMRKEVEARHAKIQARSMMARAAANRGVEAHAEDTMAQNHSTAVEMREYARARQAEVGEAEQRAFDEQQEERIKRAVQQRNAMRGARNMSAASKSEIATDQITMRLAACVEAADAERQGLEMRRQHADTQRVELRRQLQQAKEATHADRVRDKLSVQDRAREDERRLHEEHRKRKEANLRSSEAVWATASPHAMRQLRQVELSRKHSASSAVREQSRNYQAQALAVRAEELMAKQRLHDRILLAKHGLPAS